jgi:hypothetical protein
VLPVGHYWESIAGTDCDGFIKQSGKQAGEDVYNAAKDALEKRGSTLLTVLGHLRGELLCIDYIIIH